jgi:alpha-galactosidase
MMEWLMSPSLDISMIQVRVCAASGNGWLSDMTWLVDMLQVGNPGLNFNESLTHFALWSVSDVQTGTLTSTITVCARCVASAPLLAGTDVVHASNETLAILTAPELIAINQDLGVDGKLQGKMIKSSGG